MYTTLFENERDNPVQTNCRDLFGRHGWQSVLIYAALLGGWMVGLVVMKGVHTWIHLLFILANVQLISRILNPCLDPAEEPPSQPRVSVDSVTEITVSRVA